MSAFDPKRTFLFGGSVLDLNLADSAELARRFGGKDYDASSESG